MTITPPGIVRTVDQPTEKFSAKDPVSTEFFFFDFTEDLGTAETISSAQIGIAVALGTDNSSSSVVSGSPVVEGAKVKQLITGGVTNVVYQLVCTVVTNQSHQFTRCGNFQVLVS